MGGSLSPGAATVPVTFAAPTGHGERRRTRTVGHDSGDVVREAAVVAVLFEIVFDFCCKLCT
jgi:hypothetical protein